jgi:hypothetical protein
MGQRWIRHEHGKRRHGDGAPPTGAADLHFVDEEGSMAVVNGILYLNGQPAGEGEYPLRLAGPAANLIIAVDPHGKAKRVKGGAGGGKSRNH